MEYSIKAIGGFGKGPNIKPIQDGKLGKGFRVKHFCGHYAQHYGLLTRSEAVAIARLKCFKCCPED